MLANEADEAPLRALAWALETLPLGRRAPVLFLGARAGAGLERMARDWQCEQSFKPFADALMAQGVAVQARVQAQACGLSLVLAPRAREAARILLARAVRATAGDGQILAVAGNAAGGRTLAADLGGLVSATEVHAKHKCRIVLARPEGGVRDTACLEAWLALDAPQWQAHPEGGFWSRPGLFAWDRVDPASALLMAHLPATLQGRVADFGAGWGCLSRHVARHCPQVCSLDLFEAQAEALEPARRNLEAACAAAGGGPVFRLHWHDVTRGVPGSFDVVLMNPPFHLDRSDLPELGRAFIRAAAQALSRSGELWLVANRHLPYEAALQAHFAQVQAVAVAAGYKVVRAWGPRP